MKNSALFEALKSGSPQGAPEIMSDTPTAPPPSPPLPSGGGNSLFNAMKLPDSIGDATHASVERIRAGLGKPAYGPPLPSEPLPSENQLSQDALGAVAGGSVAPVRQAPMGKMSTAAKEALDAASRDGASLGVQKRLMEQLNRLLGQGR